ncbi:hypothetical protein GN958_ATG22262 [Phytophthora infestans]|uniref:Bzip transcription factor n=1 Tax=Phytophthora infestans TaxID=4787 RepID=A0A8S9TKN4_PHYIN|nr:hypothetical protein GN958_ATG22262 [Phytophthora infestans]
MASLLENPSNFTRRPLSDGLVGPVVPRGVHQHHTKREVSPPHGSMNSIQAISKNTPVQRRSMCLTFDKDTGAIQELPAQNATTTKRKRPDTRQSKAKGRPSDNPRSGYYRSSRRLEQCRLSQKRYREKKRAFNMNIVQNIEQLREEIEACKRRRLEISFGKKNNRSPWCIVADVFHLLESRFASPWCSVKDADTTLDGDLKHTLTALEKSFALNVALGDLHGVKELVSQLYKYSQYFSNPRVHLKRVEEMAEGIVTASAKLSLAVSEITVRSIFPHLIKVSRSKYDPRLSADGRLVGQTLECECALTLCFDDESGRVARMEITIDWISALSQVLGKLGDVSTVLQDALITPDCTIGGTATSGGDSSGMATTNQTFRE